MGDINKLVERMVYWCVEGNLGYDQDQRWNIWEGGECDCSSLVVHALQEAGFETGDASYTGNMSKNLCDHGWERVDNDGYPRVGDILLNDRCHVAVYVGNGLVAQASIDERGKARGGKSGDQSGYETNLKPYYDYPWDCYLRYHEEEPVTPTKKRRKTMQFLFKPYGKDYMCFWNGQGIIRLSHPDQMQVIKDTYKTATGEDMAVFELGAEGAPWYDRLAQCAAYIQNAKEGPLL